MLVKIRWAGKFSQALCKVFFSMDAVMLTIAFLNPYVELTVLKAFIVV